MSESIPLLGISLPRSAIPVSVSIRSKAHVALPEVVRLKFRCRLNCQVFTGEWVPDTELAGTPVFAGSVIAVRAGRLVNDRFALVVLVVNPVRRNGRVIV